MAINLGLSVIDEPLLIRIQTIKIALAAGAYVLTASKHGTSFQPFATRPFAE